MDMMVVAAYMFAIPVMVGWLLLIARAIYLVGTGIQTGDLQRIVNGTAVWLLAAFIAAAIGLR